MPDTRQTFNALVSELDYPMFVVTAAAGGERAGCLVGFATQCSIDPPRFLVCLSKQNRTYRVARDAELLAVHFLPADAEDLAELFGGETGDRRRQVRAVRVERGPGRRPAARTLPQPLRGEGRASAPTRAITSPSSSSRLPRRRAIPATSSRSTARSASRPATRPEPAGASSGRPRPRAAAAAIAQVVPEERLEDGVDEPDDDGGEQRPPEAVDREVVDDPARQVEHEEVDEEQRDARASGSRAAA